VDQHSRAVALEAERPEAVVGDRQREQEREPARDAVHVAEPVGSARAELAVEPERAEQLHDRECDRDRGEPDLHGDRRREEEGEDELLARIVDVPVDAERQRDSRAGEES
jgi:hypothetical protein